MDSPHSAPSGDAPVTPGSAPDGTDAGAGSGTDSIDHLEPVSETAFEPGAHVVDGRLRFRLEDPDRALGSVHLWNELDLPDTAFTRLDDGSAWELELPRPPVDRLEYMYAARESADDEHATLLLDPANPLRVGGAFGDHSWLPLPGYEEPRWLAIEPVPGTIRHESIADTPVGTIDVEIWEPESLTGAADEVSGERSGAHERPDAPLLLTHDGPEMATLAGLTHYIGALIATGELPPMRVALLVPGARDERYAANDDYADALALHVVPHLRETAPTSGPLALMGASLGGLSALHAHWRHPGVFAGLHLASGSFFTPSLDPQESGYSRWSEVTGFVAQVGADGPPARKGAATPAISMVCGTAEENLANNLHMRDVLRGQGFAVSWGTVADTHCYTCWRDLFDPHLTQLLTGLWGEPGSEGR